MGELGGEVEEKGLGVGGLSLFFVGSLGVFLAFFWEIGGKVFLGFSF